VDITLTNAIALRYPMTLTFDLLSSKCHYHVTPLHVL